MLDFGGGPGELSLLMHDIGCEVFYSDLPGIISDFALWRFRKYKALIKVIYSRIDGIDLPTREFDLIVSDATIEHLRQEYICNFAKSFSQALKDPGFLYALWDPTYTEEYPYHILRLGFKDLDKILKKHSLLRISENVYVKSSKPYFKLRHILWLAYKGGLHIYHVAKGICLKVLKGEE